VKPIFFGIIILGALVIYEAWQGFKKNQTTPAPGMENPLGSGTPTIGTTTGGANNTLALSTPAAVNYVSPQQWASYFESQGITGSLLSNFMMVVQRESNYFADATCWANGADARTCTQYQKPGDTQAAMGGLQFLGSTWEGTGCEGSPYNPLDVAKCAAKTVQIHGCMSAWGFPC
jgi:hypothetical protein